jgi:hypothetical protein
MPFGKVNMLLLLTEHHCHSMLCTERRPVDTIRLPPPHRPAVRVLSLYPFLGGFK